MDVQVRLLSWALKEARSFFDRAFSMPTPLPGPPVAVARFLPVLFTTRLADKHPGFSLPELYAVKNSMLFRASGTYLCLHGDRLVMKGKWAEPGKGSRKPYYNNNTQKTSAIRLQISMECHYICWTFNLMQMYQAAKQNWWWHIHFNPE